MPQYVATCAVRSYRTISPLPGLLQPGGIFSVALSIGSRLPGVTWHPALRSPDFPPRLDRNPDDATARPTPERIIAETDCLGNLLAINTFE